MLDAKEVTRASYGYASDANNNATRIKKYGNTAKYWWLRSPFSYGSIYAGFVKLDGYVDFIDVADIRDVRVSPAFNINLSSVIFSSLINSSNQNIYKLTLLDSGVTITPGTVTGSGRTVTVPYTVSGANADNATQVSVLMLDKPYTAGNTNNATVKFYKPLTVETSGTGIFELPEDYNPNWKAYILAEDVNGTYETDYASEPQPITVPYTAVTGVALDKTASVELGKTVALTATIDPNNATIKTITWKSGNEKIATVKDGVVTGKTVGETTITATSNAYNAEAATCKVTVTAKGGDNGNGGGGGKDSGVLTLKDGKTVLYLGLAAPSPAFAKRMEGIFTTLLKGLPAGVRFFSDLNNMTFPDISSVMSYIEEIYESLKGTSMELTAVLLPVRVSASGVYLIKVTLSDEQIGKLKGCLLKYLVEPCDSADIRIADNNGGPDDSRGVLVDGNGNELTGAYNGGDLNGLAYFAKAGTTYVQYLTTETEVSPDVKGSSPSGGCDVGFGFMALAFVLPWVTAKKR